MVEFHLFRSWSMQRKDDNKMKFTSKYIEYSMLTYSDTAARLDINNYFERELHQQNAYWTTLKIVDPIYRLSEKLGISTPKITSFYRCTHLNWIIGGASGSLHTKGQAVDITWPSAKETKLVFKTLANSELPFDAMYLEFNYRKQGGVAISHIHIQYNRAYNDLWVNDYEKALKMRKIGHIFTGRWVK